MKLEVTKLQLEKYMWENRYDFVWERALQRQIHKKQNALLKCIEYIYSLEQFKGIDLCSC